MQQALAKLQPDDRQAVLAEAQARSTGGNIRNPAAYLMGLVQRALRGDFHPWAATPSKQPASQAKPSLPPMTASPRRQPGDPISSQVQACLDELRKQGRGQVARDDGEG